MRELQLDSVLNSASSGTELANAVLRTLAAGESVTLDFASVERMTPSFANAFVMTVLHEQPLEVVRERVRMVDRPDRIAHAINDSVRRYQRGVRLSSQREPAIA